MGTARIENTIKMPKAVVKSAAPKKPRAPKAYKLPERFQVGETLQQTQFQKKKWQLGEVIGQGGFGLIYKAFDVTDGPANPAQPYVIKIEPLENGPLFCEFHFYQRVGRPHNITEWTRLKKLRYLGLPQFLGSGQHNKGGKQYRFLVMQHLSTDLQKTFLQHDRCFSEKTTFCVGLRMLDVLEYIHDKGYCHADIKAANILLGYNNGRTDHNQVYLVDFGLAYRFLVDGTQKPYKEDPKRAHDGTTEYASRDAHKGVYPSRRGDLEILGYCMLEWLAGSLPWSKILHDKDKVCDMKIKYMNDLPDLFKTCFGSRPCPGNLKKYLNVVSKLAYDEKPDYSQLRQFLRSGSNNEWNLGLSEGTPSAKGVKRKSETPGPSTPKKPRASSKATTKKSGSTATKSALVNGAGMSSPSTPSPSKGRVKTPGSAKAGRKPATPGSVKTGRKPATPGSVKTGRKPATPGSAKAGRKPATPGSAKAGRKPTAAGSSNPRKGTPKKISVGFSAGSKVTAATKRQPKTTPKAAPMKRKRNKNAAFSDSAVQTSPGFGLQSRT